MRYKFVLLSLVVSILNFGCTDNPDFVLDSPYREADIPDRMVKPKLPKPIVDEITKSAPKELLDKGLVPLDISSHLQRARVELYFNEERGSPFGGRNQKLILKGGAGEVDLREIITSNEPSSFYFGIHVIEPDSKKRLIYFMNEGKKTEFDGVNVGMPCGEYVLLNDLSDRLLDGQGLLALTGSGRHVTLLAGVYYIILFTDTDIFISHFRIKDSRFPSLSCVR